MTINGFLSPLIILTWNDNIAAYWRHMSTKNWVNIGSVNVLSPVSTKPLPEPMLTYRQ